MPLSLGNLTLPLWYYASIALVMCNDQKKCTLECLVRDNQEGFAAGNHTLQSHNAESLRTETEHLWNGRPFDGILVDVEVTLYGDPDTYEFYRSGYTVKVTFHDRV